MRLAPLAIAAVAGVLAGCGQPVPPQNASYVGRWEAANMHLYISADGRIEYERKDGTYKTSIKAPITEFMGDNFKAGIPYFETTFVVSTQPHLTPAGLKMVVDGVELTRVDGAGQI